MFFLGTIHASKRDSTLKDFSKVFPGYHPQTFPTPFRKEGERLLDFVVNVENREMRPCMVAWLEEQEAFRR